MSSRVQPITHLMRTERESGRASGIAYEQDLEFVAYHDIDPFPVAKR